jgi:hypothetical protein
MTHGINFNKIAFISWFQLFVMPKHVFYNLSYATTMSNTIKEMIKNVSKFKPWDGHQMVNIKSLILYSGVKFELKYNKTNINTICSLRST